MDKITEYFMREKNTSAIVAAVLQKPLIKYADIEQEVNWWLENRTYEMEQPVEIDGYTAKRISELAPHLDGIGVYGFLVTLRDNPEKARDSIENNFPRK